MPTRKAFLRRLNKLKLEYVELISEDGGIAYVTRQLGGRILGVFLGEENLLWVHPKLTTDWNNGGQRTWYAPEGGDSGIYFSQDWSQWSVPSVMDPGKYRVIEWLNGKLIAVENDFTIYSNEGYEYELSFSRRIWMDGKKEHLESLSAFSGLKKLHISFEHGIRNRMDRILGSEIGLWSIIQVIPPGTIIVPVTDFSHKFFTDSYYEPFPKERMNRGTKSVSVFVDGNKRYKLGFPPSATTGRIGYISRFKNGEWYAIVKLFSIDPSGTYVDKPKDDSRKNGDCIQLYNHGGEKKIAFAELECHSPAPFLPPKKEQIFPISLIFLQGEEKAITQAVGQLVGEPEVNVF